MTEEETSELQRIAEGRGAGPYRWVVLTGAAVGAAAFAVLRMGLPSLGPAMRAQFDLSLGQVGVAFSAVALGTTVTLILWGLLADRIGERLVLAGGLFGAALAMVWAAQAPSYPSLIAALAAAGGAGAAATGASGRAVMGWFGWRERGTALGIRQMALPIGGAAGSLALPRLAGAGGLEAAFLSIAGITATAALLCLLLIREPPERPTVLAPAPPAPPPLRDRRQWRLGGGSALLVVAQSAMIGFLVLYLVDQHAVSATTAGVLLAVAQLVGAAGRVYAGRVSDREGRRIAPLRRRALSSAALIAALAAAALLWPHSPAWFVGPLGIVATIATMTWNGLSFTAAGEIAGRSRAGTAMSLQNTAVSVGSAVGAPIFGVLAEQVSWPLAFTAAAVAPLLAWRILTPLEADEAQRVRRRQQRIDASLAATTRGPAAHSGPGPSDQLIGERA